MYLRKKQENIDPRILGRPSDYPNPPASEDLLFFIQRNQNKDTIVYEVNKTAGGRLNLSCPMHPYWIKYNQGGETSELNFVQNKLAYGYEHQTLGHDSVSFHFVSYQELTLYIDRAEADQYRAVCKINGQMSILDHVYVYAEEMGVFPIVKYIELFGRDLRSLESKYQRIIIQS